MKKSKGEPVETVRFNINGNEFIVPSELHYECLRCGQCCTDYWEIVVDEPSLERLKSLDLGLIKPSLRQTEPFKKSEVDPERYVMKLINGRCCFLQPDNLCGIHSRLGEEYKPHVCRAFPFIYVRTPEGIEVGCSFACTSVRRDVGPRLPELKELIGKVFRVAPIIEIPDPVPLNDELSLPWQEFRLLRDSLLKIFRLDTVPLITILVMGHIFLDLLVNFIREATAGGKFSLGEVVRSYVEIMERDRFGRALSIAGKQIGSPVLQRAYLGLLTSFRNTMHKHRRRLGSLIYLIGQYMTNLIGLGGYRLLPVARRVTLSDFHRIRFDPDETFIRYQVSRYIRHLIFRLQGLDRMPFIKAYRYYLLYYALIRWYATALAGERDKNSVDREEILDAIWLVERYYVRHTMMDVFFDRFPSLGTLIDSFMAGKRYAPSIVVPPVKRK